METNSIFNNFKKKDGSETIAGAETLKVVTNLILEKKIKSILELGAGIGTITFSILSLPKETIIDLYEPNEFCIKELQKNLSQFEGKYNLITDYRTLPPRRGYGLVIVDGGAGERNNGSSVRTILAFLSWLESVEYVYVQGYRYAQRSFIRNALLDRYVYSTKEYPDGVLFSLQKSKSFVSRWLLWLYWRCKEKILRLVKKR